MRVVVDLVCFLLRLEIESAQRAVPAAGRIEFWVEINYATARLFHKAQVGITGALRPPRRGFREITSQALDFVERCFDRIFKMRTRLVDPLLFLRRTVRRVAEDWRPSGTPFRI